MNHSLQPEENNERISNYHQKNINSVVQSLMSQETLLKREQLIATLLEGGPKSYPKLLGKDFKVGEATTDRDKNSSKHITSNTMEVRAKNTQKNFFRALEEQHRLINRENMQLLGLTISKISYSSKGKKNSCIEAMLGGQTLPLNNQPFNLDNSQNMPQNDSFIDRKILYTGVAKLPRGKMSKRPSTIRVRDKSTPISVQRKKRPSKPVNPEYANPIYEARILSYRQLLFKLQWSYGLYMEMDKTDDDVGFKVDKRYKAWIGSGNNSVLVKELIKRRFWWQICEERNLDHNFVWTQLKVNDYFKKQQTAKVWQERKKTQMSSKELYKDGSRQLVTRRSKSKISKKEQKNKQDEFLNKIMGDAEKLEYLTAIKYLRNKEPYERQQQLHLKEVTSQNQKVHNHLTNNFYLGNKKALFYNLREYYELTGGNLFKIIPLTFHIKKGMKDPQYKRFLAYHKKRQAYIKKQQKEMENGLRVVRPMRNIWIVKPGELTNRGNGITVIDQIYELDSIIKGEKKHENGTQKTFIVQLYIDRPFLYKKRKFDIRHYMMISQLHGVIKAYWYAEGYIRTASYEFDVHNFQREIHLTNDAVQKYTPHYGRYEPANKLSYAEFQKYLDTNYPKENYNFDEIIMPKMKAICLQAVKSTFLKISPERFKHNFQIFGMDFMIDNDFNPWLIEINTNPCLQLACPLLTRIIPQMVDQAFRLTLDVVYPPPSHYPNTAKHLVPEASLENLKFELIFDERVEGQQLMNLYKRTKSNLLQQIGNISDDQVYEECGAVHLTLDEVL